jgi:hypothetical protein
MRRTLLTGFLMQASYHPAANSGRAVEMLGIDRSEYQRRALQIARQEKTADRDPAAEGIRNLRLRFPRSLAALSARILGVVTRLGRSFCGSLLIEARKLES